MFSFDHFNAWKLLAGLGIFLFGMSFLEKALNKLIGRNFKKFLRRNTESPVKALLGGTIATILLQSSSIVSLMLLAFVGTGVIKLRSAIGILLGANVGTTFSGWLIVLLGFSAGSDTLAFFFITVGAILSVSWIKREKIHEFGSFLLGFGFLFLGIELMKASIGSINAVLQVEELSGANILLLFLAGTFITAIIHSSSAMTAIALSAVSTGILPVEAAAVMIIGSDLGTTTTVVLGAFGGSAIKKRVAAAHVLFNIFTAILAVFLLYPVTGFSKNVLGIESDLYTLVFFHSMFNLCGVFLLFPFTKQLATFLESRFTIGNHQVTAFIGSVPANMTELALDALSHEIDAMTAQVVQLNMTAFGMKKVIRGSDSKNKRNGNSRSLSYLDCYAHIKELEGKIVEYHVMIQGEKLKPGELTQLNRYMYAVRNLVSSAKALKDVVGNIKEFENSSNDAKQGLIQRFLKQQRAFYRVVMGWLNGENASNNEFTKFAESNQRIYDHNLKELYNEVEKGTLAEAEISTFLNINREVFNANKELIMAMEELLNGNKENDETNGHQPER